MTIFIVQIYITDEITNVVIQNNLQTKILLYTNSTAMNHPPVISLTGTFWTLLVC